MSQTPPHYSEDGRHWWDGGRWLPVGALHPTRRPPAPVAIAVSLLVILLASVLTVGLVAASGPFADGWRQALKQVQQQPGASGGVFSNLQVCSATEFDRTNDTCRADRSGQPFQTSQLVCSATLTAQSSSQQSSPTFSLAYAGHDLGTTSLNGKSNGNGSYAVYVPFSLSPQQLLPAGSWTCKFSFAGSGKSLDFRTRGPSGPLLYQSSCLSTSIDTNTSLCVQDQNTITNPSGISCTAMVVGAEKKQVKLEIVYLGGAASTTQGFSRTATPQPDSEFYPASITLQPQDVALTTSTMPAGKYVCRWSIDDKPVGEKDFQVG
jgi:hypothetical protein